VIERMSLRRRWPVAVTIAVLAVAIGAVLGSVRIGSAAVKSAPHNTNPPTVSGTPQVGSTLKATHGDWDQAGGGPISSYKYAWRRCDENGGSCASISGANQSSYTLKSVDSGNTLRVRVTATNGDGSTNAESVPTAVVKAAPAPPPTTSNGCPTSGTGAVNVSQLSSPVVLQIDGQSVSPSPIPRNATSLQMRIHVSACNGRPVEGALVQTTAVPFNQFSIPAEVATGADGWATLTMSRQALFPASPRQQILVVFVRARKTGDPILAGIAGRRLVSFPVGH
jgi:hypothetical protein